MSSLYTTGFPEYHGTINGINWSLGAEMQFYVLLALTVGFLNFRTLKIFIFGALAITFLWRLLYRGFPARWQRELCHAALYLRNGTARHARPFAAGIGLAFCQNANVRPTGRLDNRQGNSIPGLLRHHVRRPVDFERRMDYWKFDRMVIFFRTILALAFGLLLLFFA